MLLIKVEGIDNLVSNLKKLNPQCGELVGKGLLKAGLFLERESKKIVPVATGDLRRSGFTRRFGRGWDTSILVGYTTTYAIYVHEIPMRHKPGKQWKYLEEPVRIHRRKMVRIVRDYVKSKLRFI